MTPPEPLLTIRDLHVRIDSLRGDAYPLQGVDLTIGRGEFLGLVGESGCGKSMTAKAILNLLPPNGKIEHGEILLHGEGSATPTDLSQLGPNSRAMRSIRWKEIAFIAQEPSTSLSAVHTIGNQIDEVLVLHEKMNRGRARKRTLELLDLVAMPRPEQIARSYPFELSGGMRQRVAIAMALACNPKLLIADEPTTALDVTLQAQILDLLLRLRSEIGLAILLITHDMGVVSTVTDRAAVMYLGRIVEEAESRALFKQPVHPYTAGLIQSIPDLDSVPKSQLDSISGSVPSVSTKQTGCGFEPRCPIAIKGVCSATVPGSTEVTEGHEVACLVKAPAPLPAGVRA